MWFIAFPERLGKYGALDYIRDMFGEAPDLESREMVQKINGYSFMRIDSRDVPRAVEYGALFGITGLDWLEDYKLSGRGRNIVIVEELPFGEAEVWSIRNPERPLIEPIRVVSAYKGLAMKYMNEKGMEFSDIEGTSGEVEVKRGKTEGWVKAGLIDVVIDNINSGKTVRESRLERYEKIMDSYAVLISDRKNSKRVRGIISQDKGLNLRASETKY